MRLGEVTRGLCREHYFELRRELSNMASDREVDTFEEVNKCSVLVDLRPHSFLGRLSIRFLHFIRRLRESDCRSVECFFCRDNSLPIINFLEVTFTPVALRHEEKHTLRLSLILADDFVNHLSLSMLAFLNKCSRLIFVAHGGATDTESGHINRVFCSYLGSYAPTIMSTPFLAFNHSLLHQYSAVVSPRKIDSYPKTYLLLPFIEPIFDRPESYQTFCNALFDRNHLAMKHNEVVCKPHPSAPQIDYHPSISFADPQVARLNFACLRPKLVICCSIHDTAIFYAIKNYFDFIILEVELLRTELSPTGKSFRQLCLELGLIFKEIPESLNREAIARSNTKVRNLMLIGDKRKWQLVSTRV